MYTKLGLGLLAAAGLTFGVVGMQIGGASPTSTSCTNADSGVSGSPSSGGNAAAGNRNGSNAGTDNGTGAEGNGNGLGGGNGSGNGTGDGSGNGTGGGGNQGPATTTPPTAGNNGNGSTRAADDRFLVLGENTDETDVLDGTATLPPTNSDVTGRSRVVRHLLRIDAQTNVYGRR